MTQKIILDCDPGIDDALAIAFAAGDPGLELSAVTTVAGNVSLDKTTVNAQRVCGFIGADVPVVRGSAAPLLRPPMEARHVHGASGLGGARLPAPAGQPAGGHAVEFLIDQIGASPGEITLVATGPLTNIALAVRTEPRLVTQVRDFVIMGGSAGRGNVTPAAEFNIAADPEAAAIVFRAGWTVTMVGLDVTLRARATEQVRDRMSGLGPLATELLLPGLAKYATDADPLPALASAGSGGQAGRYARDRGTYLRHEAARDAEAANAVGGPHVTAEPDLAGPGGGTGRRAQPGVPDASALSPAGPALTPAGPALTPAGPAIHDVCAVAHVAQPGVLGCVPARVEVETAGRWTSGMTVTDFGAPAAGHNALVALDIDIGGFWDLALRAYSRLAAAMGTRTPAR